MDTDKQGLEPRFPVFIFEGLDVSIYHKPPSLNDLEWQDIADGVYEAYDNQGYRLLLGNGRDVVTMERGQLDADEFTRRIQKSCEAYNVTPRLANSPQSWKGALTARVAGQWSSFDAQHMIHRYRGTYWLIWSALLSILAIAIVGMFTHAASPGFIFTCAFVPLAVRGARRDLRERNEAIEEMCKYAQDAVAGDVAGLTLLTWVENKRVGAAVIEALKRVLPSLDRNDYRNIPSADRCEIRRLLYRARVHGFMVWTGPEFVVTIVEALGRMGDEGARLELEELAAEADFPQVRKAARRALNELDHIPGLQA